MWRRDDPQGAESLKIRHLIVPYTRGRGLDVGCGPWKAYDHFIGVDNFDEWGGMDWRPDVISDADDLSLFAAESLDYVYSSHLLEHIEEPAKVLEEWWRVLRPGGHLVLYLPDEDEYPKVGEDGANPDHRWNVNYDAVVGMMKAIGSWDLVEFEKRNGDFGPGSDRNEYSLFFVFKKLTQ